MLSSHPKIPVPITAMKMADGAAYAARFTSSLEGSLSVRVRTKISGFMSSSRDMGGSIVVLKKAQLSTSGTQHPKLMIAYRHLEIRVSWHLILNPLRNLPSTEHSANRTGTRSHRSIHPFG